MSHSRLTSRAAASVVVLSLCAACSTDSATHPASDGGGAGDASTSADGSSGGAKGSGGSSGGSSGGATGGTMGVGGATGGGGATIDAGATTDGGTVSDAGAGTGNCGVTLTSKGSNATATATPLAGTCTVEKFDDGQGHSQINFHVQDTQAGVSRDFGIDLLDLTAKVGTALNVADGYDFAAGKGLASSYLELSGSDASAWSADAGTVTIEIVSGKTYGVTIENVHLAVPPVPDGSPSTNAAVGEITVNGTITGTLP
jgi:hypothetical protein